MSAGGPTQDQRSLVRFAQASRIHCAVPLTVVDVNRLCHRRGRSGQRLVGEDADQRHTEHYGGSKDRRWEVPDCCSR